MTILNNRIIIKKILNNLLIIIDFLLIKINFLFLKKINYQDLDKKNKKFYIPFQEKIMIKDRFKIYNNYLNKKEFKKKIEFNHNFKSIFSNINRAITYVDVGANYGYYSISLLKEFNFINECILIEPNKNVYKIMKSNLLNFSDKINYIFFNKFIGHNEFIKFKRVFSFLNTGKSGKYDKSSGKFIKLKSYSLDIIFDHRIIKNDIFLKIDVEGNELAVLKNCPKTLIKTKYLIVEVSSNTYEKIKEILKKFGFNKFYILGKKVEIFDLLVIKED